MRKPEFDWDAYFKNISFAEVRENSPSLRSNRLPSIYSPDHSLFYVSSQDVEVDTNDIHKLASILEILKQAHYFKKRDKEYYRLGVIIDEIREIAHMMYSIGSGDIIEDVDDWLESNS